MDERGVILPLSARFRLQGRETVPLPESPDANRPIRRGKRASDIIYAGQPNAEGTVGAGFGDSGSAARYFYCPKADTAERGPGNNHPAVKPLDLLSYLCKLVSQPGQKGVLLDPFAGSGSTLLAASRWFERAIGIELSDEYAAIAAGRLGQASLLLR